MKVISSFCFFKNKYFSFKQIINFCFLRKDTEDCSFDSTVCDLRAICDPVTHTCKCIQGYIGDGVICAPDTFVCFHMFSFFVLV